MKMKSLFTAVIVLAIPPSAALGADLPTRKDAPVYVAPPPPSPIWTGFYVGPNLGGGWKASYGNNNTLAPDADMPGRVYVLPGSANSSADSGVVGGGQIGYSYLFGSLVVAGAEADIQGASIGSGGNTAPILSSPFAPGATLALAPAGSNFSIPWFGTVRGRGGILALPTLLVYITGGFAYGEVHGDVTALSNTRTGWSAGGGIEWMFLPDWSVKAEYLYVDLDNGGAADYFGYYRNRRRPEITVIRGALNYHFNVADFAPVLATY